MNSAKTVVGRKRRLLAAGVFLALTVLLCANGGAVERFPSPDFESGHTLPGTSHPPPRADWREAVDVALLAVALSAASWILLVKRSRKAMTVLSVLCLAYFGFYRRGCVCSIGAIQNVTAALADPDYYLPLTVALIFVLPIAFALLFGRVFCGGVCPLGAIQDVVLIKPVRLPPWLERALGVLPFVYLGVAVLYAATNTMFVICRYDPFVSFFRRSGPFHMLIAGGVVLALATFIGRPFCRFLCPYGALLGIFSRGSWRKASITPDDCIVCSLCAEACPFGAIRPPTPEAAEEEE